MGKKRTTIGLLYINTYQTWAGGVIYMINIVSALNTLPEDKKPIVYIYHTSEAPIEDLSKVGYPYIEFYPYPEKASPLTKLVNHVLIKYFRYSTYPIKLSDYLYFYSRAIPIGTPKVHWIPDFQEAHLPEMFTEHDLTARRKNRLKKSKSGGNLVLSSKDALSDYERLYPNHNTTPKLLHFASILPPFRHIKMDMLKEKYGLPEKYLFCPNQFWKHKNHITIIKALICLSEKGEVPPVVFTGSKIDDRNRDYFDNLMTLVKEHDLESKIIILGFLEREHQLQIMNHAVAVIQPSLFEGWSTVVEDCKAMSQYLLVSSLNVHKEQIKVNASFFDPMDEKKLAELMDQTFNNPPERKQIDYKKNINGFAENFLKVFS